MSSKHTTGGNFSGREASDAGEPTTPQLLAAVAGLALASRGLIERTDRTSYREVCEALDALHEHLAVAGGSALFLAERLGCGSDVQELVKEGQQRVSAYRAFAGHGGRA